MAENIRHCSICGYRGEFRYAEKVAVRDNFSCSNCRSVLRQRDLAQLVLDEFANGMYLDVERAHRNGMFDDLRIYEVGIKGPFVRNFRGLPNYINSYFWPDVEPGGTVDGIVCQDLTRLTFPDASFDLIISTDVLEHVLEPERAIAEIARVLDRGGVHIFSIPLTYPLPEKSVVRVIQEGGEIRYVEEPRYHVAGDDSPSLVVTEWGQDILQVHRDAGLTLAFVRRSAPEIPAGFNLSLVARKI